MKKKAICTIMVLMLFITPCYRAYADAGSIAITGGTVAVGGTGAIATGAIAGPVVVAVFLGMMAFGLNVELTNASQEAGMTKTQFIKSKLEQYCHEAQVTYGVFNNAILSGTTILQNGAIKLGSQAGTQIKQFVNWLFESNQVQESTGGVLPFQGTYSQTGSFMNGTSGVKTSVSLPCYAIQCKLRTHGKYFTYVYKATSDTFAVEMWSNGTIGMTANTVQFGNYRVIGFENSVFLGSDILLSGVSYVGEFANDRELFNIFTNSTGTVDDNHITGDRDAWSSGNPVLDPTQGKSTVINPGLTGSIPIPADTDVTVNIRDYLDALEKVLDGIQTGIVARDKDTDIPISIPIPDDTVIDPTIDQDDDSDLPDVDDQTPITDPDQPADPEQNPSASVEPLKFDLKSIFPFCIPFDIRDMLAKLSAEPVAPNYHVDWYIPLLHESLEFDINLACWNSVAAVLRKMELLSFIVGLAIITRNLIRG